MKPLKLSGNMVEIPLTQGIPKLESLAQVLMRRDRMTPSEAAEAIAEARERVEDGEDPEEVLAQEFGLEPDYVFDLLEGLI